MASALDRFRAGMVRDDIRSMVLAQLPRDLQTKLSIRVKTDAYSLGGKVEITDPRNGASWEVVLGIVDIEGVPVACLLPDWLINHLCVAA